MTIRQTCGGCPHLVKTPFMRNGFVIGCEKTNSVVPHSAGFVEGVVTLFRVPLECPLPDTEVRKSKSQAKEKFWVRIKLTDIKDNPNHEQ